ncbi:hypothetical protein OAG46_00490, partial [Planctomycetota bacterium]|nr:hypothetical protein [Planctomycetota bacterium]
MAFDEARGQVVLFGGHDACSANLGDTWTWDGSDWSQVTPAAAAPVPLFGAPFAALPNSAGLMLHGGSNPSGNASYSSTWTLDGDTWVEVGSSLPPGARAGHCTALHESTGRVLLFGGAAPFYGQKLGDTWVFAEGEWSTQLTFITSPINGHQYALTPVLNWTDAEALAVQTGGHLATIRDQAENDWLMSTFNTNAWIGFTDEASEGTWTWTSGEIPGFTNWSAGEPNNLGNEDHAHLIVSTGKWNDAQSTPAFPGLVERIDCNANGVPDMEDLSAGTSLDCNANGIPDECDIASGTELDCNNNGVPDSCDVATGTATDCNGNGVPDDCDLTGGTSSDCNGNGIPDSCDIDAGLEIDCNLNGIPDACDLLAGTSVDCDGNGIPDECDIAAGAADCNADGILDSCQIAADVTLDLNGNGALDACEAIGTTYCSPAVSNSTGLSGEVTLLGSELIVLNQFFVSARQLPPSSFGFFIASTVPGSINPVPNSQGTLCVIGDVGRGVGGGIFNAGLAGAHIGYANLLSMPQPNGPIAV